MKLKDLLEKEETTKVISVARMSDADKKKLKEKLKDISRDSDEFDEIAIDFAIDLLKHNGFVREKKSIEKALSVKEIIMSLEVPGTNMMELPAVNEFDIVMIAGTHTVFKIGSMSNAIYHPINKGSRKLSEGSSDTIELAKKRKANLTVELNKIDEDSMKHYGVDVDGQMHFKYGWSDDKLFLDVKKNRYVKTTRNGITAMPGNGMSGSATIFFDYKSLDKVKDVLSEEGWEPKEK